MINMGTEQYNVQENEKVEHSDVQLLCGDCFKEMEKLEHGSIDLIITDPPYGTVNGIASGDFEHGMKDKTEWDKVLDIKEIFNYANRVLRRNGKLILFSQEPYTSKLITEAIPNLQFCYRMVWEKDHFANSLIAKKAPVSYYEDILVFSKMNPLHDTEFIHPLRPYFKEVFEFIGLTKKNIVEIVGQGADHTFRFGSSQFSLCTKKTYGKIVEHFNINNMDKFINFEELIKIDKPFKSSHNEELNKINPSIFNLPVDKKIKSNILKYKKDYDGFHPTQKPVDLLKDLIRTYSNKGDTVLDFTMGSGSTGVACVNLNRDFIGMELDEKYFEIAKQRIDTTAIKPKTK